MQIIYKSAALYGLVNRLLYGRHHAVRYAMIADLIPAGSTVIDLCCGPATLYHRHLRSKSIRYTGLDQSAFFIDEIIKRGGNGLVWDLRSDRPLPEADYIIIQGALYFFLPDPSALIDRMLAATKRQVIIAESIRNLSSSRVPLLSKLAVKLSGGVEGDHPLRFNEDTPDKLLDRYSSQLTSSFKIPGERDKIYVLQKINPAPVAP